MTTTLPARGLKQAISYYYLVTYCPPDHISELKKVSRPLRKSLADQVEIKLAEYFSTAVPEVCRRIVAFQQGTRQPDGATVKTLTSRARRADSNPEKVAAFQALMAEIAEHPGRAKADNRLHRKKGCRFCAAPCRYGYFTLVSDPQFGVLRKMLDAENQKPLGQRNAVNVLWTYTTGHLWRTVGARQGYISVDHLGNLAYCLLMLATAKSRFALPEKQLTAFQEANQNLIQNWRPSEIDLVR